MRYDTTVKIMHETAGGYDPEQGRHVGGVVTTVERAAHVSQTGIERQLEVFGRLDVDTQVVRLQGRYTAPITRIEINGKQYSITLRRMTRHDTVLHVQEMR